MFLTDYSYSAAYMNVCKQRRDHKWHLGTLRGQNVCGIRKQNRLQSPFACFTSIALYMQPVLLFLDLLWLWHIFLIWLPVMYLPIFVKITRHEFGQSYHCAASVNKVVSLDRATIEWYPNTRKHCNVQSVCKFIAMWYIKCWINFKLPRVVWCLIQDNLEGMTWKKSMYYMCFRYDWSSPIFHY